MKTKILLLMMTILSGCTSRPFEATKNIYDSAFLNYSPNTTKFRIHRVEQLSGSALGDDCPLVLKVDENEVAGLQQNQFVDIYLPTGKHSLSIRFKCALTTWRKSLDVIADGEYQEYRTEIGAVGQYRMSRVK